MTSRTKWSRFRLIHRHYDALAQSRLFDHSDLQSQLHPGEVPVGVLDALTSAVSIEKA
jgi:hypothetical protein